MRNGMLLTGGGKDRKIILWDHDLNPEREIEVRRQEWQGSCINKVWSAILSIPIFLRVSAVRMTAYLLVAILLSGRLCFVIKSISIFSLEISPRELYLQLFHCFFCSSYFWVFALVLRVFLKFACLDKGSVIRIWVLCWAFYIRRIMSRISMDTLQKLVVLRNFSWLHLKSRYLLKMSACDLSVWQW